MEGGKCEDIGFSKEFPIPVESQKKTKTIHGKIRWFTKCRFDSHTSLYTLLVYICFHKLLVTSLLVSTWHIASFSTQTFQQEVIVWEHTMPFWWSRSKDPHIHHTRIHLEGNMHETMRTMIFWIIFDFFILHTNMIGEKKINTTPWQLGTAIGIEGDLEEMIHLVALSTTATHKMTPAVPPVQPSQRGCCQSLRRCIHDVQVVSRCCVPMCADTSVKFGECELQSSSCKYMLHISIYIYIC